MAVAIGTGWSPGGSRPSMTTRPPRAAPDGGREARAGCRTTRWSRPRCTVRSAALSEASRVPTRRRAPGAVAWAAVQVDSPRQSRRRRRCRTATTSAPIGPDRHEGAARPATLPHCPRHARPRGRLASAAVRSDSPAGSVRSMCASIVRKRANSALGVRMVAGAAEEGRPAGGDVGPVGGVALGAVALGRGWAGCTATAVPVVGPDPSVAARRTVPTISWPSSIGSRRIDTPAAPCCQ